MSTGLRSQGAIPALAASHTLTRHRWRVRLGLSAAMIVIYFGFMALFAFDKPLLGTVLAPGLTLCLLLGPLVIISGCVLALIYVLWTRAVFDPAIRRLSE